MKMEFQEVQESFFSGYRPATLPSNRAEDTAFQRRVVEHMDIITNRAGLSHERWVLAVHQEASREDFSYIFADVMVRKMLKEFEEAPKSMLNLVLQVPNIPNFDEFKFNQIWGGDERFQEVSERGHYTEQVMDDAEYTARLKKYGTVFNLSWEDILRDNMGVYSTIPKRFARAGINTLEWYLINQMFDANGPRSAVIVRTGGQSAISTLPLTGPNLLTAHSEYVRRTGQNGNPLMIQPTYLWYAPALESTVNLIMESKAIITGEAITIPDGNQAAKLNLTKLPLHWLPLVVTGAAVETTWGLATSPNDIPAFGLGFLRGATTPEIWTRSSGAQRAGGGLVNPLEGSFDTDTIDYRARFCVGGTALDPRALWASTGAGA